jgi:hypothetical protein
MVVGVLFVRDDDTSTVQNCGVTTLYADGRNWFCSQEGQMRMVVVISTVPGLGSSG